MSAVTDFKSIKRKLERMEQKAEFEANNPDPAGMYGVLMLTDMVSGKPYPSPGRLKASG